MGLLVALAQVALDALPESAAAALRADVAGALGLQAGAVALTSLFNGLSGALTAYNVSAGPAQAAARRLQGGGGQPQLPFPPGFAFPATRAPLAAFRQRAVTVVGVVAAAAAGTPLGALPAALAARLQGPNASAPAFPTLLAALAAASLPNVTCAVDASSVTGLALSSAVLPGLGAPALAAAAPAGAAPPAAAAPLSPGAVAAAAGAALLLAAGAGAVILRRAAVATAGAAPAVSLRPAPAAARAPPAPAFQRREPHRRQDALALRESLAASPPKAAPARSAGAGARGRQLEPGATAVAY